MVASSSGKRMPDTVDKVAERLARLDVTVARAFTTRAALPAD
jgi:hypothetical protein